MLSIKKIASCLLDCLFQVINVQIIRKITIKKNEIKTMFY